MLAQNRIAWVDYAKFIGIFLVVLGHTAIPTQAVNFIYAFHMPLFFFLSGYLFVAEKFSSLSFFVKHRFSQLIVPYLCFSLITYLFWLFAGRKFGSDAEADISVLTPLLGIFYATDTDNYLIHCGSLWFLPCLFLVEIIYFFSRSRVGYLFLLLIFILAAYFNNLNRHFLLPWSFDAALTGLVFYTIGNNSKTFLARISDLHISFKVLVTITFLILLVFLSTFNGRADMGSNSYHNFLLFILTALAGICASIIFSALLADLTGPRQVIVFFAKATLVILAFHSIAGSLIKAVLHFGLKIRIEFLEDDLFLNILFSIASLIVLIPVNILINKYLPFMIGRPQPPKIKR